MEKVDKRQAREYILIEILREARRFARTQEENPRTFGLDNRYEIEFTVLRNWIIIYVDDNMENDTVFYTTIGTTLLEISNALDEILEKYYKGVKRK